jgi:uncharacterized protein (DUF885 family)
MAETEPVNQTALDALAQSHVDAYAALDPDLANQYGMLGHETELTDYSPDGVAERAALARKTLVALSGVADEGHRDEVARAVMRERLQLALDIDEAGEELRFLNPISSPVQGGVTLYTLMPTENDEDWSKLAESLEHLPEMLAGYTESLRAGLAAGLVAARRQAIGCATQARARSGATGSAFHADLVGKYAGDDGTLRSRLDAAARGAAEAYATLADFLTGTYAPKAAEADGVGRDRYGLAARTFLGDEIDPEETYQWGIAELTRLREEMHEVAETISPGTSLAEVMAQLDADPSRSIEGEAAFQAWNQELLDDTMQALEGTYFDIPEPVRALEAMIAPPGGAAAMYYTPPSEDFSRPGRTWYPTLGRTRFPLWQEPSVAYHEGVPGHHLQLGMITYLGPRLNPFQRVLGHMSGYTEGWALYAERLMSELGFLDDPAYRLGMLSNQAFRAARVVLDIGLHLEFAVPFGEDAGARWNAPLAVEFLMAASGRDHAFCTSEVDRYLGWPGQAISYKVGERAWLETRAAATAALGAEFDLRTFHAAGFDLGYVGLAQLRSELGSGAFARRAD